MSRAATERRYSAAGAPSTARWSKVMLRVSTWVRCGVARLPADRVAEAADAQDRDLARGDHRGEEVDAEAAQGADGEGAALELGQGQLSGAGGLGQPSGLGGHGGQRQPVGVLEDRDHQALLEGDGEADVDLGLDVDRVVADRGVEARVFAQGERGGPDDQVGDGRHLHGRLLPLLLELGPQRHRGVHGGLGAERELGHLLQAGVHPGGDDAAHPGEGDDAWLVLAGVPSGAAVLSGRWPGPGGPRRRYVRAAHLAARAGAGHGGEVDAGRGGVPAHQRRDGSGAGGGDGGRGGRRVQHVGGDDAAARAGAGQQRDVDAALAGYPAGVGRGEQPPVAGRGRSGGGRCGGCFRSGSGWLLAGGAGWPLAGGSRRLFAGLQEPADQGAGRQFRARLDRRVEQAGPLRLDLDVHLVGGQPQQRVARLDRGAGRDEPLLDQPVLHGQPQLGDQDLDGHVSPRCARAAAGPRPRSGCCPGCRRVPAPG